MVGNYSYIILDVICFEGTVLCDYLLRILKKGIDNYNSILFISINWGTYAYKSSHFIILDVDKER